MSTQATLLLTIADLCERWGVGEDTIREHPPDGDTVKRDRFVASLKPEGRP